jgi:hypothetical protein
VDGDGGHESVEEHEERIRSPSLKEEARRRKKEEGVTHSTHRAIGVFSKIETIRGGNQ